MARGRLDTTTVSMDVSLTNATSFDNPIRETVSGLGNYIREVIITTGLQASNNAYLRVKINQRTVFPTISENGYHLVIGSMQQRYPIEQEIEGHPAEIMVEGYCPGASAMPVSICLVFENTRERDEPIKTVSLLEDIYELLRVKLGKVK